MSKKTKRNDELSVLFEVMRLFCIIHEMEFDGNTIEETKQIKEIIEQHERGGSGLTPLGFIRKFSNEILKEGE